MAKSPVLRTVSNLLLAELKKRFNYIMDEYDPEFDATYLVATFLDPHLKGMIPAELIPVLNRHFCSVTRWLIQNKPVSYIIYNMSCSGIKCLQHLFVRIHQ